MNFGGDHSAPGHGKVSPRCVPEGASDKKNAGSWQHIACMYSDSAIFGKICVACIQKASQSAVGEYTARTSCRQGAFSPSDALKSCTAHESCHPPVDLPLRRGSRPSNRIAGSPFSGLALAQGCLPPPAPRQYPPPTNSRRSLHPLQPETSRRWASAAIIRRMACSSAKPRGAADRIISMGGPITGCCAELGLDSRTVNKRAQNLRRRPQARPGLRQRCRKRPSKGRIPLDGTIGTPQHAAAPSHVIPCSAAPLHLPRCYPAPTCCCLPRFHSILLWRGLPSWQNWSTLKKPVVQGVSLKELARVSALGD